MPEALKSVINYLCTPAIFITCSVVVFAVFLRFYRRLTRPRNARWVFASGALFLALSLEDEDFRRIITTPDYVPIAFMLVLVGFFSWWAFRQSALNDERTTRGEKPNEASDSDTLHVWPHLVYIEFLALLLCSALLIVWSIVLKAPLEGPANPTASPNPAKAPWYFLGLQEMLVYYDPWIAGVLIPTLIIVGLMAIPYMDKNPKGNGYYTYSERRFEVTVFMFGFMILWVLLIILGTFLRGPNWNFFGPFEEWDLHKVQPLVNVNLSEFVWVRWWGVGLPHELLGSRFLGILLREFLGVLLVVVYLCVLPWVMARTFFRKVHHEVGTGRYLVMSFLFLMMLSLPIKMLLLWVFNLKYIVAIPEYFFNI